MLHEYQLIPMYQTTLPNETQPEVEVEARSERFTAKADVLGDQRITAV